MPHEPEDFVPGSDKIVKFAPWRESQPLLIETSAKPYPVEQLPTVLRHAVEEVQRFTQAPTALVAASAISAISLAIQGLVNVQRSSSLDGPVSLFLLTIAESGERKSSCDAYFTAVIREYEQQQREVVEPELAEYRADVSAWEAKQSGIKDKIRQETKQVNSTHVFEEELRNLELEKPTAPRIPRLIYSDATQEKLISDLALKWPSGGIVSSEAGAVFGAHSMRPESQMRTLSALNVLWDGGTLHSDRKTTESVRLEGARLTVGLQAQSQTVREFVSSTNGLARGIGFLARFLISWPASTQGTRLFNEMKPDTSAFNSRMAELLNQPLPFDDKGRLEPLTLTLAPDAKVPWVKFYNIIEKQLRDGGALRDIRDVASKAPENIARLAALFHVFEKGDAQIKQASIESAFGVIAWHLEEAKRFLSEADLPIEERNAAKLDAWLIARCLETNSREVRASDVAQFGPNATRRKEKREEALEILTELHRASEVKRGKHKFIAVNPDLLNGGGV